MEHIPITAYAPRTYKEAQAYYQRAVAVAEHLKGEPLLPGERAMLYHGFIDTLKPEHTEAAYWSCDFELVAKAARAVINGYEVGAAGEESVIKKTHKGLDDPSFHDSSSD